MSSSRLPGKILMEVGGQPMLAQVVERVRMARSVDEVIVATTTDPSDDPVAEWCARHNVPCERGSLFDVLDRYYQAAKVHHADVVVRITADCPLVDPWLIDQVVQAYYESKADFAANRLPPPWKRTYPIGLDVEVCSFAALERAWIEAKGPHQREHVMPYLYDTPGRFHIHVVNAEADYGSLRWTVDTPEDLQAIRELYRLLGSRRDFTWHDVLAVWQAHPELETINQSVIHKQYDEVDQKYDRNSP
jgi:spore coat polysaccharide biosynthesis protein SpsF